MILAKRFVSIISALLVFISFEILFLGKPSWLFVMIPVFLAIIFLSVFLLVPKINREAKSWGLKIYNVTTSRWDILISPFALVFSSLFFIIFLDNVWLKHLLALFTAFLLFVFLEDVFYYFFRVTKYQVYSLENISSYVNLASAFFFYSGAYGLSIFLKTDSWILALAVGLITFLISYQTMKINGLNWRSSWLYILIIVIICLEVFWALGFWPTSFYVNGLILATVYYIVLNLMSFKIFNRLEKKMIIRYLTVGSLVLIIILGTARWA